MRYRIGVTDSGVHFALFHKACIIFSDETLPTPIDSWEPSEAHNDHRDNCLSAKCIESAKKDAKTKKSLERKVVLNPQEIIPRQCISRTGKYTCPFCRGSGIVLCGCVSSKSGETHSCSLCGGWREAKCGSCNGHGALKLDRVLSNSYETVEVLDRRLNLLYLSIVEMYINKHKEMDVSPVFPEKDGFRGALFSQERVHAVVMNIAD